MQMLHVGRDYRCHNVNHAENKCVYAPSQKESKAEDVTEKQKTLFVKANLKVVLEFMKTEQGVERRIPVVVSIRTNDYACQLPNVLSR